MAACLLVLARSFRPAKWIVRLALLASLQPVSAGSNAERFADLRVGAWNLETDGGFAVAADEPRNKIHFLFVSGNDLLHSVSSDGGKAWSTAVTVATSDKLKFPTFAIDRKGKVHVAYAANNHNELHYRCWSDGSWSEPANLTAGIPGKLATVGPRLAIDGRDNVHVLYWSVWRSGVPNWRPGSRAVYCYKPADRERFDEPQLWANQANTPGGYGKHGALFRDGEGNIHLFYLTSDQPVPDKKISNAIERRIRRPDGTWDPRHDVWPIKDDMCDWSLAAALGPSGVVHLSAHRRVSSQGAEIVYWNNQNNPAALVEAHNAGFEPWESWTDLAVEPSGDVWLATAHLPYKPAPDKPDPIGPRAGYLRYSADAKQWTARTFLPTEDGANLGSRNYSHPRFIRLQGKLHLFHARKEAGVFRHYVRRFDGPGK
ncbi:MAG: sialidase family protein [Opitutaceae bacterium]